MSTIIGAVVDFVNLFYKKLLSCFAHRNMKSFGFVTSDLFNNSIPLKLYDTTFSANLVGQNKGRTKRNSDIRDW